MGVINFDPIDTLIETLKTPGKISDNDKVKLWQAIKTISDALIRVDQLETSETLLAIEIPKGTINGVNKTFILINKPVNFISGFKNGLLLLNGTDFIMNDNRIIFAVAPAALSVIQFIYNYIP